MQKNKTQLREAISTQRKSLDPIWQEASSTKVIHNLQTLEAFQTAKTIALYMAIGNEVNLDSLFPICWALGKTTCIPVFNAELKVYEMAKITPDTEFKTGNYDIREPRSPILTSINTIDFFTIPGIAFDRSGNRLGRGGGYYDRMLEDYKGYCAAVAFEFQLIDHVPTDPHDQPMHAVITEKQRLKVSNER